MKKTRIMGIDKDIVPKKVIWAVFLVPAIVGSGFGKEPAAFIGILFLVALLYWGVNLRVVVALPFIKRAHKKITDEARSKFIAFIGKQPKYIDLDIDGDHKGFSGCGLAYNDGTVYVLQHGEAAAIPWSSVRSWRWELKGHQELVNLQNPLSPNSVASGAAIQNANMEARAKAAKASGFFVEVADIENPVWHFNSTNEVVLRRWHEIFNQLNEGSGKLAND